MIRYALKCPKGHRFDSWFQSAAAFDTLVELSRVACPHCGATAVEKTLMAPDVRPARKGLATPPPSTQPLAPESERERALAALKEKIEAESDYVGMGFVREARAIHDGEAPARSIYGEARLDEAAGLIEDGVPVAPLPFTPSRKTN